MRILSSLGPEIDVYIDSITAIRRSSAYQRTEESLERGETLMTHRIRKPETMSITIRVTDVEPFFGALLFGRWELDHAEKTLDRLREAQAFDRELRVWTGKKYERTPAGTGVWVLDEIDGPELSGTESRVLNATLIFGESPRFATAFTSAEAIIAAELADVAAEAAERGRQSTGAVGADATADIAAGAWP